MGMFPINTIQISGSCFNAVKAEKGRLYCVKKYALIFLFPFPCFHSILGASSGILGPICWTYMLADQLRYTPLQGGCGVTSFSHPELTPKSGEATQPKCGAASKCRSRQEMQVQPERASVAGNAGQVPFGGIINQKEPEFLG